MMVVGAGASNSISELKELLALASDPKKLAKALDELQSVADDTRKLLEEKSKVEMEAAAKLKKIEEGQVDYDDKMAKLRSLDAEMKVKHQVYLNNVADLKAREESLAKALAGIDGMKAKMDAQWLAHEKQIQAQSEEAAKEIADAKALKNAYEAKLAKLKQAMG